MKIVVRAGAGGPNLPMLLYLFYFQQYLLFVASDANVVGIREKRKERKVTSPDLEPRHRGGEGKPPPGPWTSGRCAGVTQPVRPSPRGSTGWSAQSMARCRENPPHIW